MIKKAIVFGTILSALLSTPSFAALPKSKGFYLDLDMGYGIAPQSVVRATTDGIKDKGDTTGFAWSVAGGYKFIPQLAAEVGYLNFPDFKFKAKNSNQKATKVKDIYGFDTALKVIIPLYNGFNFYGKGGVAYMHVKNSGINGFTLQEHEGKQREFVLLGAAGMGYNITPNLEVRLQGLITSKREGVLPLQMITGGVSYLF